MGKIILCGDTGGFFRNTFSKSKDLEYIKMLELVNNDGIYNQCLSPLENFDLVDDNLNLLFLDYDHFVHNNILFDENVLDSIRNNKLHLVIDRRGELIGNSDINIVKKKLQSYQLNTNVSFISMNLGSKHKMEVGFDQQLVECSWRVPEVLDNVDDFYFNDLSTFTKTHKFICLNGTFTPWRLSIVDKILNGKLDSKSLISMLNKCDNKKESMISQTKESFKDVDVDSLSKTIDRLPIIFDRTSQELMDDVQKINPMLVDKDYILNLKKSFFSLVTESDIHPFYKNNHYKITEKTYKVISFHPFIIIGGCGILKYLKSLGFKTFSEMFDESYDDIQDDCDRINFIYQEVKRLCEMDEDELHKIYTSVIPKIKHNYQVLKNINTEEMIVNLIKNIKRRIL